MLLNKKSARLNVNLGYMACLWGTGFLKIDLRKLLKISGLYLVDREN